MKKGAAVLLTRIKGPARRAVNEYLEAEYGPDWVREITRAFEDNTDTDPEGCTVDMFECMMGVAGVTNKLAGVLLLAALTTVRWSEAEARAILGEMYPDEIMQMFYAARSYAAEESLTLEGLTREIAARTLN